MNNNLYENNESYVTCENCGCVIDIDAAIEFDGSCYCEDCINEVSFICDHCGDRHSSDERNSVGYDDICDNCLSENYVLCECCNKYVPDFEANYCEGDNRWVCNYCVDNRDSYFRCESCNEVHPTARCIQVYQDEINSELWCERCVDYYAVFCEECERYYNSEYVSFNDGYCEFCQPAEQRCADIERWSAPSGMRSYSYKPTPCFCMTDEQKTIPLDQLFLFGVELEMEDNRNNGRNDNEDADYMNSELGITYCKHDGSLNDGIELVTHPATLEYLMSRKEDFARVFREMTSRGYTSHNNGNCGLHVHISLKSLVADNPYATDAIVRIVDRLWSKFVRFSRRTEYQLNRWAARYNTKDIEFEEITKSIKKNCGRYMAVNVQNQHTVEIRMFRGTLKVDTFFATLQLVKRLAEVSTKCFDREDADSVTWKELINCEYRELKEYCDKRFAENADDSNDREEEPEKDNTFGISADEMHLRNIHVGDPIRLDHCPDLRCAEHLVGRTGIVSEITPECNRLYSNDIMAGYSCVAILGQHAFRTSPLRTGDYIRIRTNSASGSRAAREEGRPFYGFDYTLSAGTIGIIRDFMVRNNCPCAAVEFPDWYSRGHSCDRTVRNNRGQWIPTECLELV